jgi:hypothetical protein
VNPTLRAVVGATLLLVGALLAPFVFYAAWRGAFFAALLAWVVAFPALLFGVRLLRRPPEPRYSDLDLAFARTLKQNGYRVSANTLAEAAGIDVTAARRYLEDRLLTMEGHFEQGEGGEELFVFRRPATQ